MIICTHRAGFTYSGIPDFRETKEIGLAQVFVMQRATENAPVEDCRRLVWEDDRDEFFTADESQLHHMMVERIPSLSENPPVKFDSLLKNVQTHRFVVLGKPGAGKSSLLKNLLLTKFRERLDDIVSHRSDWSPSFLFLVEIRRFEHAMKKSVKPGYSILKYLYDYVSRQYSMGTRKIGGGATKR